MKYRKSIFLSIGLLLTVLLGTFLMYSWVNGPVSVKPVASNQTVSVQNKLVFKQLSGKYFNTSIPSDLMLRVQNQESQGIRLEQVLVVSQGTQQSSQLAISVGVVPAEGLEAVSDIQYRMGNPKLYLPATITGAPANAIAFTNTDTYETSVFWKFEEKYASVVLSGFDSSKDTLDQSLSKILSEWQWK